MKHSLKQLNETHPFYNLIKLNFSMLHKIVFLINTQFVFNPII